MRVSEYVSARVKELLASRRVVAWYDPDRHFLDLARELELPGCTVIVVDGSRLAGRRDVEAAYLRLENADHPEHAHGSLLVVLPWRRPQDEQGRQEDPFEVFACVGASFGDRPAEELQALARLAMPEHVAEIDRLFKEGCPTLDLLDSIGGDKKARYPLVRKALGVDTASEVLARVLATADGPAQIAKVEGALAELKRLVRENVGYQSKGGARLATVVEELGRYVLASEFLLDLECPVPAALASVPHAEEAHREAVYTLCARMRGSDDTRPGYLDLAHKVEATLRLPSQFEDASVLGRRDTFPFEEATWLGHAVSLARSGDLPAAREVVTRRRSSVWRHLPERALLWKLAERCLDLLEAAAQAESTVTGGPTTLPELVTAYVAPEGLWHLDLFQRRVEHGAAECAESDETDPLVGLCRSRYRNLAGALQDRVLAAVRSGGWPPDRVLSQTQVFDNMVAPALAAGRRVAYFLVDGMRYEMGRDLAGALEAVGSVTVQAAAGVLPATTMCGMAALMPGAHGTFKLVKVGSDLVPEVGGKALPTSAARMDLLRGRFGDRFKELTLGDLLSLAPGRLAQRFSKVGLLVVRTQDIDQLGEGASHYQARKLMTDVLHDLMLACQRLQAAGFELLVLSADHGHLLLPEVAAGDVVAEPRGEWPIAKRRCRLGHALAAAPGTMAFPAQHVGIHGPVAELVVPEGLKVFTAGDGYAHEGLSLQEGLVPVISVAVSRSAGLPASHDVCLQYKTDRFTSRIVGLKATFRALLEESIVVRIQAFSDATAKARVVGEAADCDARDPATGLIELPVNVDTQVPLRIDDDFTGPEVEIRAIDPGSGVVLARLLLRNQALD